MKGFLFLFLFLQTVIITEAQTRGLFLTSSTTDEYIVSRKFALVIGGDLYDGKPSWVNLNNPIYDAETIGEILKVDFNYDVQVLRNPTSNSLLQTLISYHTILNPTDRLFIFIAGHGDFDDKIFDDGFLVTKDSKPINQDPNRKTYISYTTLNNLINKLPAKQIFLCMDVCFSGAFNSQLKQYRSSKSTNMYSAMSAESYVQKKLKLTTRSVLTSGGIDPVLDGIKGSHSPFAYKLIEGLRVMQEQKTVITGNDLYNYVAMMESQPIIGYFGSNAPAADYVVGITNSSKGKVLQEQMAPPKEKVVHRGAASKIKEGVVYDKYFEEVIVQKFYIQLLSEPSFQELEKSIEKYNQFDIKMSQITINSKLWYRLYIGGFNDKTYAQKQLSILKKSHPSDQNIQASFIKELKITPSSTLNYNTIYTSSLTTVTLKGYSVQVFSDPMLSFTLTKAKEYKSVGMGKTYIEKVQVNGKDYYRLYINNFPDKNAAIKFKNQLVENTSDVNLKGAFIKSF
ncbi:hypothetical protein EI427_24245 [Flammeovirga pectinis]|uniref:SPOR domain-containing protein n=1 Tax=Flammeovirga pectinis TaxID=2494373 RepID=A0A3Q9FSD6_9BACT|nr:SPOR domain-containing protein [Flammeovirga pectinis]AZQ65328.1 hypothetical protein EI427_24245 [Flammeovirga pectinis]